MCWVGGGCVLCLGFAEVVGGGYGACICIKCREGWCEGGGQGGGGGGGGGEGEPDVKPRRTRETILSRENYAVWRTERMMGPDAGPARVLSLRPRTLLGRTAWYRRVDLVANRPCSRHGCLRTCRYAHVDTLSMPYEQALSDLRLREPTPGRSRRATVTPSRPMTYELRRRTHRSRDGLRNQLSSEPKIELASKNRRAGRT
jgi:hypothetical protein